jgi:hypothetical protein
MCLIYMHAVRTSACGPGLKQAGRRMGPLFEPMSRRQSEAPQLKSGRKDSARYVTAPGAGQVS